MFCWELEKNRYPPVAYGLRLWHKGHRIHAFRLVYDQTRQKSCFSGAPEIGPRCNRSAARGALRYGVKGVPKASAFVRQPVESWRLKRFVHFAEHGVVGITTRHFAPVIGIEKQDVRLFCLRRNRDDEQEC